MKTAQSLDRAHFINLSLILSGICQLKFVPVIILLLFINLLIIFLMNIFFCMHVIKLRKMLKNVCHAKIDNCQKGMKEPENIHNEKQKSE